MWEITDKLFLGDRDDARDRARLRQRAVTHVLNCVEPIDAVPAARPAAAAGTAGRIVGRSGDLRPPPRPSAGELYTNSCKYGARSTPGGRLRAAWDVRGANNGSDPTVALHWEERGGPPVSPGTVRLSLGTELVNGFVARELGGRCALRYGPGGAEHPIEFRVGE